MAREKFRAWLQHGNAGQSMRTEGPFKVHDVGLPPKHRAKQTRFMAELDTGAKRRVYRYDRGAFLYIRDKRGDDGWIRVTLELIQ